MAEEQELTAPQRWGSREPSGCGKVLLLGAAAVFCAPLGVGTYFGVQETDEREARQEILNARYVEEIELFESSSVGHPERVKTDGTVREDCDATDDDYLECEDDPQPTLDPSAG